MRSIHLVMWAVPTLSLGTFLQECNYCLLGNDTSANVKKMGIRLDFGLPHVTAEYTNYIC